MDLSETVFVSAWLELDRPAFFMYKELGQQIIDSDLKLVLYISPRLIPELQIPEHRKSSIIIKPTTILTYQTPEILEKYKFAAAISKQTNKCTPLYYIMTWNKFIFLNEVCKENPFSSKLVAWLDFGFAKMLNVDLDIFPDPPLTIQTAITQFVVPGLAHPELFMDKVRICNNNLLLDVDDPTFFKEDRSLLPAGFFLSSIKHMSKLCTVFDQELRALLDKDIFIIEEHLLGYLAVKYPDMFSLYYGWHCDLFRNFHRLNIRYWLAERLIVQYREQNRLKTGHYLVKYIYQSIMWGSAMYPDQLMRFIDELYISCFHCDRSKCIDIATWFLNLYEHFKGFKEITDMNADHLKTNLQHCLIGNRPWTNDTVDIHVPHPCWAGNVINKLAEKYWVTVHYTDGHNYCNIVRRNPAYVKNERFKRLFEFETSGKREDIELIINKFNM